MKFYPLEKLHQLHEGYCRPFSIAGRELLLFQNDGQTYLINNRCPHMDAPLNRATFTKGSLRCPVHGIEFELASGKAQGALASCLSPLSKLQIAYEGNMLGVIL